MSKKYSVHLSPGVDPIGLGYAKDSFPYRFDHYASAVHLAKELTRDFYNRVIPASVYVANPNGKITYMLPPTRTSCIKCGNELEGKKHCPLCNRLHHYC